MSGGRSPLPSAFWRGFRSSLLDGAVVLLIIAVLLLPSQIFGPQLFEALYRLDAARLSPLFPEQVQGWEPYILGWSRQYRQDPDLIALLMYSHSCGDPQAFVGEARYGLFGVPLDAFDAGENVFDPDTNARRGLTHLARLTAEYGGDAGMALVHLYSGAPLEGVFETWSDEQQVLYLAFTGAYHDLALGRRESAHLVRVGERASSFCQERLVGDVTPAVLLHVRGGQAESVGEVWERALGTGDDAALPLSLLNRLEEMIWRVRLRGSLSPVFSDEVRRWEPEIYTWADAYGLEANVVATIMQIESCGNPLALSPAGAQGLFQVMPFHFEEGEDAWQPQTNARRGLQYFVERRRAAGGNLGLTFAQYNGGAAILQRPYAQWPQETKLYYSRAVNILDDVASGRMTSATVARLCGPSSGAPAAETWLAATRRLGQRLRGLLGQNVSLTVPVERPFAFEAAQRFFLSLPLLVQQYPALPWSGGARPPLVTGCLVEPAQPASALAPISPYRVLASHTRKGHGLHGCEYNNPGVDFGVHGAKGTVPLFAPISGEVKAITVDQWGNTLLKTENEQYIVILLHGQYEGAVYAGQRLVRGRTFIGFQDSIGNSSGPHTHLSVYDKRAGGWVDPFAVMNLTPAPRYPWLAEGEDASAGGVGPSR